MICSAKAPEKIVASNLRRGFDDICILIKREEDILPPEELVHSYRKRRDQLETQRNQVFIAMGSPNKNNLNKFKGREKDCKRVTNHYMLAVFFDIGDRIMAINLEMNKINKVTRKGVPLMFSQILMGVARETLDKSVYEDIYAKSQALEQQGFLGTADEWAEFVSTLD